MSTTARYWFDRKVDHAPARQPIPSTMKTDTRDELDLLQSIEQGINTIEGRQKEALFKALAPLAKLGEEAEFTDRYLRGVDALSPQAGPAGIGLRAECERFLQRNPEQRAWLRSAARVLCKSSVSLLTDTDREFSKRMAARLARSFTTGDGGLGQALAVDEKLGGFFYTQLHRHAAFRTLGVIPMDGGKRKFTKVSGMGAAYWLTPTNQGATLPETASIGGSSISPEVATVGTYVNVSGEVVADGEMTFEGALLTALIEGLAYRIDWTAFQGDGTDDLANGTMTGIFSDSSITAVEAEGIIAVESLGSDHFADLIGGVAPSALSHPCRFWIAPNFLPKLLKVRVSSGEGGDLLLKPPTSANDEWRIHGFPVTWVAAAPTVNEPGAKVAAFGREDAYTVGIRQDFALDSSTNTPMFAYNMTQFRILARARCQTRDASALATLKLGTGE